MEFNNLQDFRNVHQGEPIFVTGAGPSLRFVDSSLAKNHIVVSINKSILKFTQAKYFFTCDAAATLTNYWMVVKDSNCKIIIANNEDYFGCFGGIYPNPKEGISEDRIFYLHRNENRKDFKMCPNDKLLLFGTSSVHPAVHFAYILGGNPIILLGCDCTPSEGKIHFSDYEDQPNGYFLEKYRKHLDWPCMSQSAMLSGYKGMLNGMIGVWRTLRKANLEVNIIDASGGRVDAFPRENLDVLLRRFSK